MLKKYNKKLIFRIKPIFLLLLISFPSISSDVGIVGSPDISDPPEIPLEVVQRIFVLDIKDFRGQKITVFSFPKKSEERKIFMYEILGLKEYQYDKRIQRKLYTGNISPPIEVVDEEAMIRAIEETPGSIGYVMGDLYYNYNAHDVVQIRVIEE